MMKKAMIATVSLGVLLALSACAGSSATATTAPAETTAAAAESTAAETSAAAGTESGSGSMTGAHQPGQYKLKIGTVVSGDHSWVKVGEFMVEELSARSGGAFEVSFAPGGQLGNDEAMIDDMRLGTLDMIIGGTQNAAPFVPQYQILSMPYLFADRTQFESILDQDGEVFNYIQAKYDENGLGLKLLGLANGGQRDLHTNSEINSVADLKNLKMRVTSSATESLVWTALGTIPTSMSFNDIYSGIQTNTVNAFECTLAAYNNNALYEVAPYHVVTAHQFTPTHITCSEIAWNKLPEDLQKVLYEVSKEAAQLGSKLANESDDTLLSVLEAERGVKVSTPDRESFKAVVEPLYPEIAAGCKGEELLSIIEAKLQ